MITGNFSKNKVTVKPNKDSIHYNLPLHTSNSRRRSFSPSTNFKNSLWKPYRIDFKPRQNNIMKIINKLQRNCYKDKTFSLN